MGRRNSSFRRALATARFLPQLELKGALDSLYAIMLIAKYSVMSWAHRIVVVATTLIIACETVDPESEVYIVYSTALRDGIAAANPPGPLFIRGRAPVDMDTIWFLTDERDRPDTLQVSDATWASFRNRNRDWAQVVDSFTGIPEHTVLDAAWENVAAVNPTAAEASLGQRYRDLSPDRWRSRTVIMLSRPGFNRAATEALVHISYWCSGPCGFGEWVLLRRKRDGWEVVGREQDWVG